MIHSLKCLLPTLGSIFFLLAGSVAGAEGDGPVSRDRNLYLKHTGGQFSHYLELRGDGSYRRVVRGHLYLEERDRGKWQQSKVRKLLLRSDQHFRNISSGDLLISMWQRDRLKTLPDLRQRIQDFLKANPAQEFPAEDIEHISETGVSIDPQAKSSDIIVLGPKRVTRTDLEQLLVAIDAFLPSGEKNLFALVPLEYKTATIFVDDDRAQLTKSIITGELAGSSTPAQGADKYGYREIDAAQFDKEVKETRPVLSQSETKHREKQPGQE
ncbi:MAG: hypothetical protein HP491_03515 [Nitrospira sp.]|nr:hypothetical protein [Nitrospira sp.]